jgi:hypothetical protein
MGDLTTLLKYNICHKIYLSGVYNWKPLVNLQLGNHHHSLILEHFYHAPNKSYAHLRLLPISTPTFTYMWICFLLSVSMDLFILDILY